MPLQLQRCSYVLVSYTGFQSKKWDKIIIVDFLLPGLLFFIIKYIIQKCYGLPYQ